MNEKAKILEEAKKSILSVTAKDLQNDKIIEKITELRISIDDLFRIYRFPSRNGRKS